MHIDKNKVKLVMARRGFDLADLAAAMGCTKQNLQVLFTRKASTTKTVNKMSKALGCDPADIVTLD